MTPKVKNEERRLKYREKNDNIFFYVFVCVGLLGFFVFIYIYSDFESVEPELSSCVFDKLTCKVYQPGRYYECQDGLIHERFRYIAEVEEDSNITGIGVNVNNTILPCADVSSDMPFVTARVCGYQEANAWFDYLKNKNDDLHDKIKMECY
jgi:hypothetical protein